MAISRVLDMAMWHFLICSMAQGGTHQQRSARTLRYLFLGPPTWPLYGLGVLIWPLTWPWAPYRALKSLIGLTVGPVLFQFLLDRQTRTYHMALYRAMLSAQKENNCFILGLRSGVQLPALWEGIQVPPKHTQDLASIT